MKSLEEEGCHFLSEDESPVGMLGLYLHKSNIPITVEEVRKQIISICKTVIDEGGLPKSDLIFPSSKTGSLHLNMPNVVFTCTMEMVSESNHTFVLPHNDFNEDLSYMLESERTYFNGGHIFFVLEKNIKFGTIKIYTRFILVFFIHRVCIRTKIKFDFDFYQIHIIFDKITLL